MADLPRTPPLIDANVRHDRRKIDRAINDLELRMLERAKVVTELKTTLDSTREDVTAIKAKLDQNSGDTREVLDILHAGKGFFRVVGWFGGLIKWVAVIGAPLVAFWYTIKHGGKP